MRMEEGPQVCFGNIWPTDMFMDCFAKQIVFMLIGGKQLILGPEACPCPRWFI